MYDYVEDASRKNDVSIIIILDDDSIMEHKLVQEISHYGNIMTFICSLSDSVYTKSQPERLRSFDWNIVWDGRDECLSNE